MLATVWQQILSVKFISGNGKDVNLLKFAKENLWNHIKLIYFVADFSYLEPLGYAVCIPRHRVDTRCGLNTVVKMVQNFPKLIFWIGYYRNYNKMTFKVLSFLEPCFDLISGSKLSMKIQIMGGKLTENLGLKSQLRNVNFFFFSFSNSSHKSGYFNYFLISCLNN